MRRRELLRHQRGIEWNAMEGAHAAQQPEQILARQRRNAVSWFLHFLVVEAGFAWGCHKSSGVNAQAASRKPAILKGASLEGNN